MKYTNIYFVVYYIQQKNSSGGLLTKTGHHW